MCYTKKKKLLRLIPHLLAINATDQTSISDDYGDLDVSGVQKNKKRKNKSFVLLFKITDP